MKKPAQIGDIVCTNDEYILHKYPNVSKIFWICITQIYTKYNLQLQLQLKLNKVIEVDTQWDEIISSLD